MINLPSQSNPFWPLRSYRLDEVVSASRSQRSLCLYPGYSAYVLERILARTCAHLCILINFGMSKINLALLLINQISHCKTLQAIIVFESWKKNQVWGFSDKQKKAMCSSPLFFLTLHYFFCMFRFFLGLWCTFHNLGNMQRASWRMEAAVAGS